MLSTVTRTAPRLARSQRLFSSKLENLVNPLNEAPCNIAAERAMHNKGGTWQGAANPTYLKAGVEDKVVCGVGLLLGGASLYQLVTGFWHMAHGTGKKE